MRTAAILVASLLATIGTAAPMSELADNGLHLYKREPLPPLTKDDETSKLSGEMEGVKGGVFDKLAKGVELLKTSRFGAVFQRMKRPGHGSRPKSPNQEEQSADVNELKIEDSDNDTPRLVPKNVKPPQSDAEMEGKKSDSKSITEDADMEDLSSSLNLSLPEHFPPPLDYPLPPLSLDTLPPPPLPPSPLSLPDLSLPTHFPSPLPEYLSSLSPPSPHSSSSSPVPPPAPPLPPSNWGRSPLNLKKVVDDDDSKKHSPVSITPKTNSGPEVQRPTIDLTKVNLKPVVQRSKPQHMPEPPSYQFQLRKTAHGGSKGQSLTNKNTDQEMNAQEPSTSYQQKSPKPEVPSKPKVSPKPKVPPKPKVGARPDMKPV
ncbi:hypothetical protein BASA50_010738 [Batrachochytrium salamandrivorans]|uniref:Uncharacterized protein n=1 Tax=Batrachochytrium salamandrivorans TaxID=1357716 RepID=A0ABQ8EXQ5_9FUNG|nr:hypothetical protein BASA62_010353 [Batrachochytrium salamandrivorans]KAH6588423.1 hypothetical protein BASA50_010738 [Batrachochytrium salamandrivorans]KAH9274745.1 hypothetical protein BASA83_002950 [Batrachochytrium salamandrivorans]